ncbi:MAG: hypothetical protein ABIJ12_06170 [bacterium]
MRRICISHIIFLMLCFIYNSCDLSPTRSKKSQVTPIEIQIEKTHSTIMGTQETVDVTVNSGRDDVLGFNILLAYDASALAFQSAEPGDIFEECDWDYFTYRYGMDESCNNIHQSGMIKIIGITDLDVSVATCNGTPPYRLFTLNFLTSSDPVYDCMYLPIRFYWCDCESNSILYHSYSDISDPYSNTLGISRYVYDFEGFEITDNEHTFPYYFGAPDDPCMEGENIPQRHIDFINGAIDNVCTDSIDARIGDLNMNGIANEIADVVLFSDYFVYGTSVFSDIRYQFAASDVNLDGITHGVADLVYQINIIIGNALPYEAVQGTDTANFYVNNNILNVSGTEMGAAFIIIEGNVTPQLLNDQMVMRYSYDEENDVTRTLIYSFEGKYFEGGNLLLLNGNIKSIEMATSIGKIIFIQIEGQ